METLIMSNQPPKLDLEETELRLGLPGGGGKDAAAVAATATSPNANGKRLFQETIIDLKLNLSSNNQIEASVIDSSQMMKNNITKEKKINHSTHQVKPPAKAQVVGWPPVRSIRKNILTVEQNKNITTEWLKLSIDGLPYLRKVDLKMYKSYQQLSDALGKILFSSFATENREVKGMIDFMNENKLMDLSNSDYVPTYEDKDGDWMLVGDVPWGMFVESCKRLRIMKGTDAAGLAPRALEKCKNRSRR